MSLWLTIQIAKKMTVSLAALKYVFLCKYIFCYCIIYKIYIFYKLDLASESPQLNVM